LPDAFVPEHPQMLFVLVLPALVGMEDQADPGWPGAETLTHGVCVSPLFKILVWDTPQ